jgi:hypothetical protein
MNHEIYSRQTRLREIGVNGQQLIAEARTVLGTDEASKIAAEYLKRAGTGCVRLDATVRPAQFVHLHHFTHPVASKFAHGSWLATQKLLELLGTFSGRANRP